MSGAGAVRVTEAQLRQMLQNQHRRRSCRRQGLTCGRSSDQPCLYHRPFGMLSRG